MTTSYRSFASGLEAGTAYDKRLSVGEVEVEVACASSRTAVTVDRYKGSLFLLFIFWRAQHGHDFEDVNPSVS